MTAIVTPPPNQISLTDNTASALNVFQGSDSYFGVDTTDGSEKINFGSATINPGYEFFGTGDIQVNGNDINFDNGSATASLKIIPANGNSGLGIDSEGDMNISADIGLFLSTAFGGADISLTSTSGDINLTGATVSITADVTITGSLTVGSENVVTTTDTLELRSIVIGAGSESIQIANSDVTAASITVNSTFEELIISAATNGTPKFVLLDSVGGTVGEFFYEDLNDTLGLAGLTDFDITSSASMTIDAQTTLDFATATGDIIFSTLISTERMRIDSATGAVSIGGALTVGGENAVTTTDTLDSLTLMVGNGSNSLQAADASATTANISINSEFDEILITAAVNGDASYKLLSSGSVEKFEAFYEDDNDVMVLFSAVEFTVSSNDALILSGQTTTDIIANTGDIIFSTLVSSERMRIASGGAVTIGNDFTVDSTTFFVDASASSVGMGSTTLEASALFTMTSTTQGFRPPSMTDAQRDAIVSPASGLFVYSNDGSALDFYNGTAWRGILSSAAASIEGGGITFGSGSNSHSLDDDPTNFFWDVTTTRLGIGNNTPTVTVDISGSIRVTDTYTFFDGSTQSQGATRNGFIGHINTGLHKQSFDISTQSTSPDSIFWKPDGTRVFVRDNVTVHQYEASTAWDVSTLSFTQSKTDNQGNSPNGLFFSNDGLKMYQTSAAGQDVNEWDVTTAWDISTISFLQSFTLVGFGTGDVFFKPDGLEMYISDGGVPNEVNQFTLTTSFDISTASFTQASTVTLPDLISIHFSSDGKKFYELDKEGVRVIQEYNVTTPWDVSTFELAHTFDTSFGDNGNISMFINPDATKLYTVNQTSDSIHEYDLGIQLDGNLFVGGNIGIGTDSPLGKLDVKETDADAVFILDRTSFTVLSILSQASRNLIQHSGPLVIASNTEANIRAGISTGFDTNFAIDGTGNVSIGHGSPDNQLDVVAGTADTAAIFALETTGTNGALSEIHVGIQNPDGIISGTGGNLYITSDGESSGLHINREATSGTDWSQFSVNPSEIVVIDNADKFDDLASGGIVTVSVNTTFKFRKNITTSNRIVVNSGITLHLTGEFNGGVGITYSGTDTFITTDGGTIRAQASVFFTSTSTGTFMSFAGSGVLNINLTVLIGWDDLGTFTEGTFLNADTSYVSITSGWTITDPANLIVNSLGLFGTSLTDSLFKLSTKESTTIRFDVISAEALSSTASILDLDTRISNNVLIIVKECNAVTGTLYKKSTVTDAVINSVADASPTTGTITTSVSNGSGGTTISCTTTYFEDEEVTISGATASDGTYQIFNVVAGVSFDIIRAFTAEDTTGSVDSERLDMTLAAILTIVTGSSIKTIDMNFYNAFYTVLDVTGAVITVNGEFITGSADTGTVEIDVGLDQSDPRLSADENLDEARSESISFGSQNGNTTATTSFTDQVYKAIALSGVTIDQVSEGFQLVSGTLYQWEYIRSEPFNGILSGSVSMLKSGATANYQLAMSVNSAIPDFSTAPFVPIEVKSTQITKPFAFPAALVKGDTFELMVAPDGTTDDITFTDIIGGTR